MRHVVLRDSRDENGAQFETAQLEDDGTLRITGHDQGPAVTEFFGDEISSYEWVYVVAPERVGTLVRLLGGHEGDDVLALIAAYYRRNGGVISDMLKVPRSPPTSATGTAEADHPSCCAFDHYEPRPERPHRGWRTDPNPQTDRTEPA